MDKETMADKENTIPAVMANNIEYIKRDINDIKSAVANGYVTKAEFTPIKNVVYGLVGLILTGVVGALIALVVR